MDLSAITQAYNKYEVAMSAISSITSGQSSSKPVESGGEYFEDTTDFSPLIQNIIDGINAENSLKLTINLANKYQQQVETLIENLCE